MSIFKVKGGIKLNGIVKPQGSKNETLQILCAVLLTSEEVRIKNIPEIKDVKNLISILSYLGVKIKKNKKSDYTFKADSINLNLNHLKNKKFFEKSSLIRGSIMLIGPLIARFGKAYISKPGGDKIGRRRLDTHLNGFNYLGIDFNYNQKYNVYSLKIKKYLIGKYILLEETSITATANILMTVVLAEGKSIIYNAACEPYIQQLCKMLNYMGANIKGIGSNLLEIIGVNKLNGCKHTIMPDIIEIGSWIGLAAITASNLLIKSVNWSNLGIIPSVFKKIGISIKKNNDDIIINSSENYCIQKFIDGSILTISDAPWPGLTPDLLSILLVVATQAKGSVLIHQKMFESRLFFVDKLIDMGAQIILCDPHRATVIGLNKKFPLKGCVMSSPDIRAGISLLIAALSAEGTSIIHNIDQIDRGYENIDIRLRKLGANITRI